MNILRSMLVGLAFFCSAYAQERPSVPPTQSIRKVVFKGKQFTVDEYLSNPTILDYERKKWHMQCDRHSRLSPSEIDELSNDWIRVELSSQRTPLSIDAFGLSAVPQIRDPFSKQWANFIEEVREEVRDRKFSDKEFVEFLLSQQERVMNIWRSVRHVDHPKRLSIRARLGDIFSRVRNRQECWLLISLEVVPDSERDGFFESELRNRIDPPRTLAFQNSDQLPQNIEPHPESEASRFEFEFPLPLKAGRNSPGKSVPGDELSNEERSKLYSYGVENAVGLQKHQVENVSGAISEDFLTSLIRGELARDIDECISPGTIVSYDELHRVLGHSTRKVRNSHGNQFTVKFQLVEYKRGKNSYTEIKILADRF